MNSEPIEQAAGVNLAIQEPQGIDWSNERALDLLVRDGCQWKDLPNAGELTGSRSVEDLVSLINALTALCRYYQDAITCAPDAYLLTDVNGVIREANVSAAALLSSTPQRLKTIAVLDLLAEEDRRAVGDRLFALTPRGEIRDYVIHVVPFRGGPFLVTLTTIALVDHTDCITSWLCRLECRPTAAPSLRG